MKTLVKRLSTLGFLYPVAAKALRLKKRFIEWKHADRPVPDNPIKGLLLAVTNICNAKCVFCAYPKINLNRGVMSYATAERALEMFKPLIDSVDLTPTVGDPLIDKGLCDKIRLAKGKGLRVTLTTNAILPLDGILEAGVSDVFISMPSFDSADYRLIYGVDKLENVQANLERFFRQHMELNSACQVVVRFRNNLSPKDIVSSEGFKKHLKPYLSEFVSYGFTPSFDNWGGAVTSKDLASKTMVLAEPFRKMRSFCQGTFGVSVRHDGKVRACGCRFVASDEDDLIIGHIDDGVERLQKAANNLLKEWKRGHLPSTCKNCSFYNPA